MGSRPRGWESPLTPALTLEHPHSTRQIARACGLVERVLSRKLEPTAGFSQNVVSGMSTSESSGKGARILSPLV